MFAQGRIASDPLLSATVARLGQVVAALLSICAICVSPPSYADNGGAFEALYARVSETDTDTGFLLDGQFAITLSAGAREALENGIPLVFELQIQLVRKHRWIWDSVEAELKITRHIQYHHLSRTFLVKDQAASMQESFRRLSDALNAAGSIERQPLGNSKRVTDTANYNIRLRGSLDVESLPTPVRLIAYVSSVWDMNSDWYVWSLDR